MQHRKLRSRGDSFQTKKLYHPLDFLQPTEPSARKEVEDTTLDLSKPFTEGLEEDDASLFSTPKAGGRPKNVLEEKPLEYRWLPMWEKTLWQKRPRVKRKHGFPTKREPQSVYSLSERSQV